MSYKQVSYIKTCIPDDFVDGEWGYWSAFGPCSKSCGEGQKTRKRICNDPSPRNGGRKCAGKATEVQKCKERACKGGIHLLSIFKSFFKVFGSSTK